MSYGCGRSQQMSGGWHDLTGEEYQVVFEEYFNQNIGFDHTGGYRGSD